jgi:hypothetical protein
MDKRFRARLLDRIAELNSDDEGERLMSYLDERAGAERQARYADRQKGQGKQRVAFWADPEQLEALRERYPGPRGGIDWSAVAQRAVADANSVQGLMGYLDKGLTLEALEGLSREDQRKLKGLFFHWLELVSMRLER